MECDDSMRDEWHKVRNFAELADALRRLALEMHPESDYAMTHGDDQVSPIR